MERGQRGGGDGTGADPGGSYLYPPHSQLAMGAPRIDGNDRGKAVRHLSGVGEAQEEVIAVERDEVAANDSADFDD